jgi:GABA permease
MRNPFRTEAEAFGFVIVAALVFLVVALVGAAFGGWWALLAFLLLAAGVAVWMRSEPKVREPAVWEHRPHERRRILVIANETVAGEALRSEILRRAEDGADVYVVCPALNSPLRHWASDEDQARARAEERLQTSLAALAEAGVEARGEIGDADPLQAVEDCCRMFDPDEMIISTHPPGRSNWLERDLIEVARAAYDLPITHVVVDLEAEAASERSRASS